MANCHPRLSAQREGKGIQVDPLSGSIRTRATVSSSTSTKLWDLGPLPLTLLAQRSAGDDTFCFGA